MNTIYINIVFLMDKYTCLWLVSLSNAGRMEYNATHKVQCLLKLFLNFVLIRALVEKPVLQRFFNGNGRRNFKAIPGSSRFSSFTFTQSEANDSDFQNPSSLLNPLPFPPIYPVRL